MSVSSPTHQGYVVVMCGADNEVRVLGVAKHRPPPSKVTESRELTNQPRAPPAVDQSVAAAAARKRKEEEESAAHKEWMRQYLLQQAGPHPNPSLEGV